MSALYGKALSFHVSSERVCVSDHRISSLCRLLRTCRKMLPLRMLDISSRKKTYATWKWTSFEVETTSGPNAQDIFLVKFSGKFLTEQEKSQPEETIRSQHSWVPKSWQVWVNPTWKGTHFSRVCSPRQVTEFLPTSKAHEESGCKLKTCAQDLAPTALLLPPAALSTPNLSLEMNKVLSSGVSNEKNRWPASECQLHSIFGLKLPQREFRHGMRSECEPKPILSWENQMNNFGIRIVPIFPVVE